MIGFENAVRAAAAGVVALLIVAPPSAALEKKQLAGAGLDVTDPDPLPEGHALAQMPNVIISPHVGGQSAGAMSVAALITAPAGRGLFRRAVIESGHLDAIIDVAKARETTGFLLERLGVDSRGDVLDQLRGISTFRITALQRELGISRAPSLWWATT